MAGPPTGSTQLDPTHARQRGGVVADRSARGLNLACWGDKTRLVCCGSWRVPPRLRETRDRRPPGTKKNRSLMSYGSFKVAGGVLEPPTSGL